MSDFLDGKDAALAGKALTDNPFLSGEKTRLGADKMTDTDRGWDWINGFNSIKTRTASKKEIQDAEAMDISKFRRKSNRFYR